MYHKLQLIEVVITDLAAKFSVRSIPYLLVFESGEVKETLVGLKQQKELIDILS